MIGLGAAEDGAVALEAVLVAPLLVLIVAALLGTLGLVNEQLTVTQAARAAARTLALTGERAAAVDVATVGAPGADVVMTITGRVASVRVTSDVRVLGVGVTVDAAASAPLEPLVP